MPNFLKKFILIFVSLLTFSSTLFVPLANAATGNTWYKQDFDSWYNKVYDDSNPAEIYGERYTAAQVEWIFYGTFAFLLNHLSDQSSSVACMTGEVIACINSIKDAIEKLQKFIEENPSANAQSSSLSSLVFQERSFSGIGYTKNVLRKFTLVPEAHAQVKGFGFQALETIQKLWAAARNFAYALSVLIILVFSFMIMFRVKISPQVVISVQSAIPKVIIALILVTFSYAIAGFLIDLMYAVIGLLALILSSVVGSPVKNYFIMTDGIFGFGGFLSNLVAYSVAFFWVLLFALFVGSGNVLLNVTVFSGILTLIFILTIVIVGIVMIFMFFKILWLLLKTLAQIYLLIIVGPIQIMMGTFMQGAGIGAWLKALISNLAVYPVVGFMFQLSFVFLFYALGLAFQHTPLIQAIEYLSGLIFGKEIGLVKDTWGPPLTLGEGYISLVFLGVSFVILTLIPKSAEIIQGYLSGKPISFGAAIGEAFAPVKTGAKFGLSYFGGRETEIGQEEYQKAKNPFEKDEAKAKIRRGEFLKSSSNLIH